MDGITNEKLETVKRKQKYKELIERGAEVCKYRVI